MKINTVSNLEYLNWLKNFAGNSVPEPDERFAGIDIVYRSARYGIERFTMNYSSQRHFISV